KDSFPHPRVAHQIVKARRLEINRVLPRRRRLFVVTSNAVLVEHRTVLDSLRAGRRSRCRTNRRNGRLRRRGCRTRSASSLCYQQGRDPEIGRHCRDCDLTCHVFPFFHCSLTAATASGLFFASLSLSLSPASFLPVGTAAGGGLGAGSLGPRCIRSRKAAMTSSFESCLGRYASRSTISFGFGTLGFSASSKGVRLSLLTASSLAPAAASARMIATCCSC